VCVQDRCSVLDDFLAHPMAIGRKSGGHRDSRSVVIHLKANCLCIDRDADINSGCFAVADGVVQGLLGDAEEVERSFLRK
jgi:hypothetical protein